MTLTQAALEGVCEDFFEGPEKTLVLCFKSRRVAAKSLRLIPRDSWENVLKHARCEILSVVESQPIDLQAKKTRTVSTKGITGYLLSESSLFVSDTSLTLKTCGRTTPLAALESLLDLCVPSWRHKDPEQYLKYATFMRSNYIKPEEQPAPHSSWAQEVQHMNKYFQGEDVILGAGESSQHVYAANYLPEDQFVDVSFCQVVLTDLDTSESMRRYAFGEGNSLEDPTPLTTAWEHLHGDEKNSVAANVRLDEKFFEPCGYSSNAVFGKHFTTIHIAPQPCCSYLSAETSLPLSGEHRKRFIYGVQGLCNAETMSVTQFAFCRSFFTGFAAPEVANFDIVRSSHIDAKGFACAHHSYKRAQPLPGHTCVAPLSTFVDGSDEGHTTNDDNDNEFPSANVQRLPGIPLIKVQKHEWAPIVAAKRFLESADKNVEKDLSVALFDTAVLKRQAKVWHQLLPRVEPFYAVKCNPHPTVVRALWSVWQEHGFGGFDCASPSEMEVVRSVGVDLAEHVVYANPCKQVSAVNFAKEAGIRRLVFDNVSELEKLARVFPSAELLLRVQTDDALTQCPLSNKFGAAVTDCGQLLSRARALGSNVIGVSFHVGSGCSGKGVFRNALRRARAVFDEAGRHGFQCTLLDIGGGFPGWDEKGHASFANHAGDICELLEELFPSPDVRVIAEPGRFFVATAQAMLTTVVSVSEVSDCLRYYLNDGLYGAFNCLLYDHASVPKPIALRDGHLLPEADLAENDCTVFGPTCDGFDVIAQSMALPRLVENDRLVFPNMGAYTTAASTSFNGFAPAEFFVYESKIDMSHF